MARRKKEVRQADGVVMWKSVLFSGIFLGVLFSLTHLFLPKLIDPAVNWHNRALIGLKVLILWLVVSSTIRAIDKIREKMPAWQLALGGILTAVAGCLVNEGIRNAVFVFRGEADMADFDYRGLAFFSGLGFILSLVSMINLRVKNRFLGNVLEFLVVVVFLAALFYLVK